MSSASPSGWTSSSTWLVYPLANIEIATRINFQVASGSEYVSEFLGRERLVRRMSVVQIDARTLDHPDGGPPGDEPRIPLSSSLTDALAAALASPTERAAVFDADRYLGDFTATSLIES